MYSQRENRGNGWGSVEELCGIEVRDDLGLYFAGNIAVKLDEVALIALGELLTV